MLCYKEVHKYNGHYYSRFDNGYEFIVGEICKPSGGDYIYATDTIANVLKYAYVPFDMAILEMEIPDGVQYKKSGYVITSKAVRVIREVTDYERYNKSREQVHGGDDTSKLYCLLQERRKCILQQMQGRV